MPDEQIIYLDPNDELIRVREKIEQVPARRIIMVVPQQTQLRSNVGWRLLHARARELGKEIQVISSDRQVRAVAKSAGFRVSQPQEGSSTNKMRVPPTQPPPFQRSVTERRGIQRQRGPVSRGPLDSRAARQREPLLPPAASQTETRPPQSTWFEQENPPTRPEEPTSRQTKEEAYSPVEIIKDDESDHPSDIRINETKAPSARPLIARPDEEEQQDPYIEDYGTARRIREAMQGTAMRVGDGSDLLGANDARNAFIGIIYVAPSDDRPSVLEAILMQDKLGRKQVAVVLPENSRAFQRPVDFDGLKNMRRGLKTEIIFVASGGSGPADFARQRRFTVYTSLDSYISALRAESPDNGNAKKGLALFGRKPKLSSSDVGATSEEEQEDPYVPDHYSAQRIREAAQGGISARPLAAHQPGNRLERGTIPNQPEQLPQPQNTLGANIQSTPASSSKQPIIKEPLADHPRQEVLNYTYPPKVRDENSSPEQKGPDHAQSSHHAARNISLPPAPEIATFPQVGDKLPEKQLSKLEGVINVEPATPLAINKPAPIFEVPKTKDRSGQQFGNYRLIRLLGHGGFADVYLGQHLRLKTHAAIKVLHTHLSDTDIEDFQKEAETIANLHHPNIVRILDFDVEGDIPFLVMDHAPHGTLRGRYPKGSRLPLTIVVSYVKQVADALGYAHGQKLIHRDIKPENILLGPNDEVLLSDFGIAVVGHSSRSVHTENQAGTVYYMAPEQIQGKPRRASDQYALAVVVYEWLTGARPFTGTAIEIITQHLTTIPPSLRLKDSTIPPVVEQVIMIALAKDPDQRFARIQAFANALEKAIQLSR